MASPGTTAVSDEQVNGRPAPPRPVPPPALSGQFQDSGGLVAVSQEASCATTVSTWKRVCEDTHSVGQGLFFPAKPERVGQRLILRRQRRRQQRLQAYLQHSETRGLDHQQLRPGRIDLFRAYINTYACGGGVFNERRYGGCGRAGSAVPGRGRIPKAKPAALCC